jgi:hypothetical protein
MSTHIIRAACGTDFKCTQEEQGVYESRCFRQSRVY